MEKIKIIVDSGHSIEKEEAEKYNIGMIPFKIHFKDKTYTDQKDITSKEFFKKIKKREEKVTTSIPGVGEVIEQLEQYIEDGYNRILCFTIAPSLSGMYNMVNLAKDHIKNDKVKIDVINTKIASVPLYFLATNAVKRIEKGESYQEIYKKALEEVEKANVYVRADTLDYLVKGGRLPKPIAKVANFVNFSPIFCMIDGEIKIAKKVIGKKKSLKELAKIIKEKSKEEKEYIIALAGGDSVEELKALKKEIKEEINNAKVFKEFNIPPVFGVHLGPKALLASVLSYKE